jgi:hypothetical protein
MTVLLFVAATISIFFQKASDFIESLKFAESGHSQILGQDHYGSVVLNQKKEV